MPSKFTEDEQARILLVLALNAGHSTRAAAQLNEEGFDIGERQLRNLVHTPRYHQIREQQAPKIERNLVEHYKDAARRSLELHAIATERAIEQAHDGNLKDPAKAAQNAAVAAGVASDKALVYEGRPTVIHADTDPQTLVQRMSRELGITIDSTATEAEPDSVPLLPQSAESNARNPA